MELSPERVRAARIDAEMSQRLVAEAAGVSVDTVRRAENGLHEPGANALGRIAAALGVSIDSLYVHAPEAVSASTGRGGNRQNFAADTQEAAASPSKEKATASR